MPYLPRPALAGGLLWILACLGWFVFAALKASARDAARSHGYPGRYPGLLLNGIALVGLTPVVSAVQYIASKHYAFWSGAGVLIVGLILIAYHLILSRRPADRAARPTVATFRELSLAAQMAAILTVYGAYAARFWGLWRAPLPLLTGVTTLIGITILMILIGIAAHMAIALYVKPERIDERDQVIALRGTRNGYRVVAVGVWCVILLVIAGRPSGLTFCALMAIFPVAELARLGSEPYAYRFGA
jgi:hypothetical protein